MLSEELIGPKVPSSRMVKENSVRTDKKSEKEPASAADGWYDRGRLFPGAVMDISGINRNVEPQTAAVPVAPVDDSSQHRDVIQAVKALNATEMFGEDNELVFQMDPQAHRMVVRVVNRKTMEVVSQIPPEYVVRLHEDFQSRPRG